MANRDTGFNRSDADWTRGRGIAISDADALARREISMARRVTMAGTFPPSHCTAWEDCKHDGLCHDPSGCGAVGPSCREEDRQP